MYSKKESKLSHIMRQLNRIYISPSILLILIFSICFQLIDELIVLFSLCLIHEIGHVLMSKIFKCHLKKFTMSIFGFSAEISDVEYLKFYQQILIYLAGPLTYFVSFFFLFIFKENEIINLYQYQKYMESNLTLALFNLIPLYPLDGGRIIDAIYKKYFPVRESILYRKIWSIISLIPVILILVKERQIILLIIIVGFSFMNLLATKYEYLSYLEKRLFMNIKFSKKYSFKNEIFHFYHNYYLHKDEIKEEKEIIPSLIVTEQIKKR